MAGLTDDQRTILLRHLAALEDDARAMEATADLFRPEFEACWRTDDFTGSLGPMLNQERALQLRDLVITGASNAKYNRRLADTIRALIPLPSPVVPTLAQGDKT